MDREQVKEYLSTEEGRGLVAEQGYSKLSKESVSSFLDTEDGKALKFSIGDTAHNNYIKKMEEKGQKIYDADKLKGLRETWRLEDNPTLTPEQVELKEMRTKFANMEKKETMGKNYKEAIKLNEAFGIPNEFLDKFVVEDFEATKTNIETFGNLFKSALEKVREDTLNGIKAGTTKPGSGKTVTNKEALEGEIKELSKQPMTPTNRALIIKKRGQLESL